MDKVFLRKMFVNRKRILIIKDLTIPYTSGSGINTYSFARRLVEEGINTTILTFSWNNNLRIIERKEGVRIIRLPVLRYSLLKPISAFIILLVEGIMVGSYKNIIVTGISPGYLWAILAAKLFRKRCVFRSTTLQVDDAYSLINRKKYGKCIRLWAMNSLYAYHALNPRFAQIFFKTVHNKRIKLLECGQGLDNELYKTIAKANIVKQKKELNLPANCPIFISVGNITLRKGYIETFRVLSKFNQPFYYCIIGEYKANKTCFWNNADEASEIITTGRKLLGDKLKFLGKIENVHRYLQVSDVYILNSSCEGLPNSLMEAMSCGVVSAVSNIDGVNNYLVQHRENALVHYNSHDLLKNIEELLQNKRLREEIAINARNTIDRKFSYKIVIPQYLKILGFI